MTQAGQQWKEYLPDLNRKVSSLTGTGEIKSISIALLGLDTCVTVPLGTMCVFELPRDPRWMVAFIFRTPHAASCTRHTAS